VLFWSRIVVNAGLLILLGLSARYLWQLRAVGLRLSNIVFTLELAYIFGVPIFEAWLATYGTFHAGVSLAETDGVANVGVGFQAITLYPAIGLLLLNSFWPNSYRDWRVAPDRSEGVVKAQGS
jgi:hypothetical protein